MQQGGPVSPTDLAEWVATIKNGGLLLVLVVLIAAFVKKWVVPGWVLERAISERDKRIAELTEEKQKWEDLALQAGGLAARFGAAAFPGHPSGLSPYVIMPQPPQPPPQPLPPGGGA